MNIIVCAKQILDISEMKVDSSTKKPILSGVPYKISDIDKNALEEAIKIKEKNGGKISVITNESTALLFSVRNQISESFTFKSLMSFSETHPSESANLRTACRF